MRGPFHRLPALMAMTILSLAGVQSASPQGNAAANGAYEWRPVAIGGGGFITGLDWDRLGRTRVARTDVYGAYVWSAQKDRWMQLVTSASMPVADWTPSFFAKGVYAIAVAPSDPGRIYMAIAGNLYRSADGGRSFQRGAGPFPLTFDANGASRMNGPALAVNPENPDIALFGSPRDGLLRTADGGRGWNVIANLPHAKDDAGILTWFGGGAAFAFSSGNGLFRSADGGQTFTAVPGGPARLNQGVFAADGTFYGVDAATRALWTMRGGAWTDLSARPGLRQVAFTTVTVSGDGQRLLLSTLGGDTQLSDDAGAHWRTLPHRATAGDKDPPWLRAAADLSFFSTAQVRFDPADSSRVWVAQGTGVFYADMPPGASQLLWTSRTRGIEELVTNDVIAPPGIAPLFGALDFGIHRKPDLDAFSTGWGPRQRALIAIQQMDWSGGNPNFIVTTASDTRHCCAQDGNTVLAGYSTDGGINWTKFGRLPAPPGTSLSDPWRMAYGTIAVSANDINNIVWEPSLNRAPFVTRDRGMNWQRVVFPGEKLPNTGSHSKMFLPRKTLAADKVMPGRFYLVHSGEGDNRALTGLWRTNDGGTKWTKVFEGEISPRSAFAAKLRAMPGKAGYLFFTTALPENPGARLMRSIDGGEHWTAVTGVDRVADIGFGRAAPGADYPAIYIAGYVDGQYGVWRSIDNAAHWTRIGQYPVGSLDIVTDVSGDMNLFGRVYLGFEGSGWSYGTPSACKAAPPGFGDDKECFAAR